MSGGEYCGRRLRTNKRTPSSVYGSNPGSVLEFYQHTGYVLFLPGLEHKLSKVILAEDGATGSTELFNCTILC